VLATSREALGIAGERVFHVPTLAIPDADGPGRRDSGDAELERARRFASVQLFEHRARQVRPDFEVTPENLAAVLDICRRLDGLPLAIELAAARTRALDVSQIRDRLDQRFRILTGGSRGAIPHHQTLHDLIDWSYQHLLDGERKLFARLSAFGAGWSLEGMEAVCAGDGLEEWELLDILSRLIDKSLAEMESREGRSDAGATGATPSATRYRMLESVREFARSVIAPADREATDRRYRDYYIDLAQRSVAGLIGLEQKAWLSRMDQEYDNLRAAVRMTIADRSDCKPALVLTSSLQRYWMLRSNWTEPQGYLREALALPGAEARTLERGAAVSALGQMCRLFGSLDQALTLFGEAISILEELGAESRLSMAYNNLGGTYLGMLKPVEALPPLERSLELARRTGDEWMRAAVLTNMGNAAESMGDFRKLRSCQEEALPLFRKLGDRVHSAYALLWLGIAAYRLEEFDESESRYGEALQIAHEVGDRWLASIVLVNRANIPLSLGRYDEARAMLRESIRISAEMDDPTGMVAAIEDFAEIANREGRLELSVRIRAGCDVLRRERQSGRRPVDEERIQKDNAAVRARMGDAAYEEAERKGAALTKDELLRLVLEEG
jgi:predicted ATPase